MIDGKHKKSYIISCAATRHVDFQILGVHLLLWTKFCFHLNQRFAAAKAAGPFRQPNLQRPPRGVPRYWVPPIQSCSCRQCLASTPRSFMCLPKPPQDIFAQTSTRHSTVAGGGLNGITNLMHSRHVQLFPNIIERGSCFRWSTAECKCFTSLAFVETSRFPELHMHETSSPQTLPKLTPRPASGWKVHPSPHTVKLHVTSVFIFPRHRHSSPFRARPPGPTLSPRKGQQSGSYAPTTP